MKYFLKIIILSVLVNTFTNAQTKTEGLPKLSGAYLGQTPPDSKSILFAPGFISTGAGELNSVFSKEGNEFYFSRRGIPGKPSMIMVTKMLNNVWTNPVPVNFKWENDGIDLFLTNDGKSMIFCSAKQRQEGNRMIIDHDFMISNRINDGWSEPQLFAKEALSEFEDYYPVITKSGSLYFNSQRGGPGTNDIFCSKFVNGKYTTAEKLPEPINTKYREFDAFVTADESIIIFSSEKPGGFGAADIYISFRTNDGKWTEPKNPGNDINSNKSEYGASISPDGKYFFYTSNKAGSEDIYWVSAKFIDELRPKD